jgi:hypothetical protein
MILSYEQMNILVSALVKYRDDDIKAANELWSGTAMADACWNDAAKASVLIDIINNARSIEVK